MDLAERLIEIGDVPQAVSGRDHGEMAVNKRQRQHVGRHERRAWIVPPLLRELQHPVRDVETNT